MYKLALEEKDRELQLILDTIMESVMILEDGKIVDLNPQAIKTFRLKNLEEGLGLTPLDFVPKYNHHILLEGLKNPDTPPYQFDVLRRDGTIFPALIHGKNLEIAGKKLRVTSFIDISELKEVERALASAKVEAEKSTKAKSEFLANVSHEIRTPMHGIIGMSHLVLEEKLDIKTRKYIQNIHTSATSLLSIIDDILDFSKLEAGKFTSENIDFDMFKVIDSVLSVVEFQAHEKQLKLQVEYDDNVGKFFYGDPLRISQILTNLLGNAVKFTEYGFVKLTIQKTTHNRVQFCVEDSGIGIEKTLQEKLFNSFTQADTSTTREYGGSGLGLSISKQLIELMDGKIWIESTPNIGSSFLFEISLQEKQSQYIQYKRSSVENQLNALQNSINTRKNLYILLVEDNKINQEIFTGFLEKSQINIDIAENGKEAIKMSQQNNYDLIFMDLQMPVMGGIESAKFIRKKNTHTPIIALSANSMKQDITRSLNAGMNEHLSKPLEAQKLYETIVKYTKKSPKSSLNKVESNNIEIPQFQSLETKSALKRLASSKKLYLKILNNFYNSYKDFDLEKLNTKEFEITVHTIKSLSINIGSQELNEVAKSLEKKKTSEDIKTLNRIVQTIVDEIQERLQINPTTMPQKKQKAGKANILIVDDDKNSIEIVDSILHEYTVTSTYDATEAIELTKENNFDLIILDIMMPVIDGYQLCWKLKKETKTKDIPIIFLTANTDENSIERAYSVGANDYVTKPIKPKELLIRIDKELALCRLMKELEYKASYDVLTKIFNRRKFFELADLRFHSDSNNIYAIMIDIDYFKKINDTHGHAVGDIVLQGVAKTVQEILGNEDIFARLGGEEFAILTSQESLEDVKYLAEKIRVAVENCSLKSKNGNSICCTVSLGIAYKNKDISFLDILLNIADIALYEAKKSGRNRIITKV